jgi:hypothetical protein
MRQGADAVQSELRSILDRMSASNKMISGRAEEDVTYGFTATAVHEDIYHATVPGSSYSLGGIHALAHAELRDFFAGDSFYALGIDAVMGSELGKKSLTAFAEMVGLVLISVFCPPAGIVLGIELAAYHLAEAYQRQRVYEALIDPDLVLSRAEVELGLFAAWLGVVLSVFPVLGKLAGVVAKAAAPLTVAAEAAGAAEGEVASGAARMAAAGAAEQAAVAALEGAERDLVAQFIRDLALNEALGKAIGVVLSPVLEHVRHDLETSAAVGGVDRAMALVIARRKASSGGPAQ